ncbi:hypothetical protein [Aliiroseovarius sp. 2305UL8-7]|uniref:hypothetical protein n=1 Tax=Aliiroseovarius conchicola TaxID=3121637 RepID=UPI003528A151
MSSRSEATLLVLFALLIVLYVACGLLDYVRERINTRIGTDLDMRLGEDIFLAMLTAPRSASKAAARGLQDVEAVRAF